MKRRHVATIGPEHVGHDTIQVDGEILSLRDVIGYVLPLDFGKHVYLIDGVLQVENESQRDERLARERKE